jgi:hypothetical protein
MNKIRWGTIDIIPMERSRVAEMKYKVGVISSPANLKLDDPIYVSKCRSVEQNPLLLLYRISKDSKPSDKEYRPGKRHNTIALFEGLDNKVDVLGLVIEFPKSKIEPYDYISQIVRSDL